MPSMSPASIDQKTLNFCYDINVKFVRGCGVLGVLAYKRREAQPVDIEMEWNALEPWIKQILFSDRPYFNAPWHVFEWAAANNRMKLMEDCWTFAETIQQKAKLLRGYFYGAVDKAASKGYTQVLEKILGYAKIVGTEKELLEQSMYRVVPEAVKKEQTSVLLQLLQYASTVGYLDQLLALYDSSIKASHKISINDNFGNMMLSGHEVNNHIQLTGATHQAGDEE